MFRTHELRLDRVPSRPRGQRCPRDRVCLSRPPAAFQRPAPVTLDYNPPQDVRFTRHQRRFTVVHPGQPSPRLWSPAERDPRAFPELRTRQDTTLPRTSGRGRAIGHCPDYVPGISQPPSTYSLTPCDNASQGTLRALWPRKSGRRRRDAGVCRVPARAARVMSWVWNFARVRAA